MKSCWKLLTACCCRRVCRNHVSLELHVAWAWWCLLSHCRISWPFQIIPPANGWKGCFKRQSEMSRLTWLHCSFQQQDSDNLTLLATLKWSLMTWHMQTVPKPGTKSDRQAGNGREDTQCWDVADLVGACDMRISNWQKIALRCREKHFGKGQKKSGRVKTVH